MMILVDRVGNEGDAYGRAPKDSLKCFSEEPAHHECAGRIDSRSKAFTSSEESEIE